MFGEKKEVFGLRKSKVTKSLQGAVLGTAFFIGATATASVASADEAVPATNLTDKQDANFNNTSKTTEGVKDTSVQVNYEPSAEYKQALSDAKAAGVEIVPNDQVVEKEAKDTAEADALKKQLDKDYAAKTEELKAAKEKVEKGGTTSPDYIAYEKAKGEYDKAWADYNKQKTAIEADRKRITAENERIDKENQEINKQNAAKLDEFNKKLKEYVAQSGKNYSYLYALAIEDAIDDDKDTANIWNVDIQGGTPLKTENVDASLNSEYYKTLDPAYWVGKEATTYTKANLGKVEAYAVRLKAGQSITVRYSYKNGQNLRVASDKVFENTNGIETPVKYVEYTYKLDQALTSTGEEIVYVTNDANIPFYRGVSDYSQLNENGPKSGDLPLDGVRKYDTTIRALGSDYRPLRLRYLIRQADGSQKPLIDYLDVMDNNLFVNAQKETLVSRKSVDPKNLTEEHGTKLDGEFVNIKDVKDLDPDFKNKVHWMEQWSGMLDNKGTGIRFRTFSHPVDTIKQSQNRTAPSTTQTVTNYRPGNFEVYASDGTVIPASEYKLEVYPNASSAPTEVKNLIKSGDLNEWGGWKLTFNDANDFYYKYVQNDKNLRVSWTLNPTDGKGEVKTVNQEFDLSKYKNQIAPKEKQITIDVTSTGKGTVTWSYKDADGRTTTAELNEQQYAQKVAEGKADAYLNVTTTDENGHTSTSRKHYTDYFDSIRNPKVKKVTVTQTVHPYWTEPFTFWGAGMMKATSTTTTSGVAVAGQTDVASIGAMRSDFKFTNNAFPPVYNLIPLGTPKQIPDLPKPPSMEEPKKPKPVSARVELLPTYVIKLRSGITKKVKNTDGTDLHNKTVAKGSDVLWELKVDNLPAGRKETKKVVFEDVLPDGYELNLADTTARNPLYDVTYDAKTRKLTFTAKASTLATWNKKDASAEKETSSVYSLAVTPLVSEVSTSDILSSKGSNVLAGELSYSPISTTENNGERAKDWANDVIQEGINTNSVDREKLLKDYPDWIVTTPALLATYAYLRTEKDVNWSSLKEHFQAEKYYSSSVVVGADGKRYLVLLKDPVFEATTDKTILGGAGYGNLLKDATVKLVPYDDYAASYGTTGLTVENGKQKTSSTSRTKPEIANGDNSFLTAKAELNGVNGEEYLDALLEKAAKGEALPKVVILNGNTRFNYENRSFSPQFGYFYKSGTGENKFHVNNGGIVSSNFNTSQETSLRNLLNSIEQNSNQPKGYYSIDLPNASNPSGDISKQVSPQYKTFESLIDSKVKPLLDKGVKVIYYRNVFDKGTTGVNNGIYFVGKDDGKFTTVEGKRVRDYTLRDDFKEYMKSDKPVVTSYQSPVFVDFEVPENASIENVRLQFTSKEDFAELKKVYANLKEDSVLPIVEAKESALNGGYIATNAQNGLPYVIKVTGEDGKVKGYKLQIALPSDGKSANEHLVGKFNINYQLSGAKEGSVVKSKAWQKQPYYNEKNIDLSTRTDTYVSATSTYAEAEVSSPIISGRVVNDNGNYRNNFVFKVNDGDPKQGGSTATSNIVETHTRDVHPVKQNLDADGNDINNLARTHGSTNYYTLTWDLDQYKDIVATENTIRKGFYYFDDFPEEAVIPQSNLITYKLEDGTAVKGITANVYTSVENAPEEIKEVITKANLKFKGAFQVFKADDAKAFFDAYVKTGKNIKIVTPMKVRDDFNSTEMYKNNAFQVDFGNGYYTNEVQNYVVKPPKPRKSNYNAEGVNINGKTMLPGSENHYTLLWDLSSYKRITSTPDEIANGFYMVDDYPEDILDIVPNGVEITDLDNAPVKGITATVYNSLAEAPENVRKAFEKSTYKPNGRIQVFSADNPEDFYNKYVKTGKSLNVVTVMRVKQELAGRKETYKNTAYQVGYGSAATTETVTNQTPPPPKPDKKVENNEGTDINGKPVISGSTLVYKLGWDLTNFKDISATTEEVDKGFYFIDDFPENELSPKDGWKIVDSKGNVVEDMVSKVYDSVSAAPEAVRTLLSSNKVNINGKFQVFYPNSTIDFYNKYVLKGEKLTIVNPMTVTTTKETKFENRAFQGEFGMVRETNPVHNETPKPKPVKEVQNVDGVNINNSIVPINSTNVYVLTWDLDQYKGIEANKEDVAKGFLYVDDFPEEALTEQDDKVQFKLEDGTEVKGLKAKTYNSLAEVPENLRKLMVDGAITPTGKFQLYVPENNEEFYNTYVKTGKNIKIYSPMVVKNVKDKTEFVNKGFQIDFGSTYKTDEVKNSVRIPEPHKRNLNKDSVDINKVPMHVGSTNYYTMDWDLDQYKGIKADKGLIAKGFHYVDDYPEEAVTINAKDVRVKTLDGKDVTDFVEIKQYASWNEVPETVKEAFKAKNYVPKGAVQVISAKDATKFYNEFVTTGRSLQIVDPMTVKPEMAGSNKSYYNTAYQVDFGTAYVTETVENPVPNVKPVKKDLNKDGVDINNQVTTKGTVHHYTLTWDLSSYKDSIVPVDEVAKGFYFVDDYPENTVEVLDKEIKLTDNEGKAVEGVTVTTYQKLSDAPKAVQEAVAKSKTTINGTFQVFSADNPTDFYKRYVQTGKTITIVDAMRVKKEFAKEHSVYKNQGFQIEFGNLQATEIVKNEVPEVTPVKRNLNKEKVDINGTPMAIGMDNYYTMTWKLDQYKGMTPSKDQIAKGFMYIDDYPEEAVSLLADQLKVTTPDGKEVKGLTVKVYQSVDELDKETRDDFAAWGLNPKGAFQVISADNPEEFYETYVKPGINLTIVDPMRVKDEMRNRENTRYENTAYQWDMGVIAKTDTVYNDVPKVTPKKQNLNKARVDINGKEMLAGSTNYYLHTWDLDQYKGLKADKETIAKGMFFVDDYPEDVVDIIDSEVRVFVEEKTAEGVKETPVSGIKVTKYASLEEAPEVVQNALKEAGYKVNGAIQVFTPEDPQAFYDNYVAKGISLKILDPMTVKEKMANIGGRYENSAFQIDFGKAQATEIVYNNIPKYSNKKEVKVGDKDVNNSVIELNQTFTYVLNGVQVPADRADKLWDYSFKDDYQESHDLYEGVYNLIASVDFELQVRNEKGEVTDTIKVKKGDNLNKYAIHTFNKDKGIVTVEMTKEFYDMLDNSQPFGADLVLTMKRIASGEVENTFENTVNGVVVKSNTVKTTTPEPKVPEKPKKPGLPNTGTKASTALVSVGLAGMLAAIGLASRKRRED